MTATDTRDNLDGALSGDELAQLTSLLRRAISLDLRVAAVAKVVAFDPLTEKVRVTMENLPVRYEGDKEIPIPPVALPPMPVFIYGTKTNYVSTPITPGTTGVVIFSDRCLTLWLEKGVAGDPINGRTHDLADGMFFPGIRTTPGKITTPIDQTATVVEGAAIKLGRLATDAVTLDLLVQAQLTILKTAITAAAVVPLDGGASFKAALIASLSTWPSSMGAGKTKAI